MDIQEIYSKRMKEYEDNAGRLEKRSGIYSTVRLITFVSGTILTILAFVYLNSNYGFISMGAFLVLFVSFVIRHQKIIDEAERYRVLTEINKRCISRMEGTWTEFADEGMEYADPEHMYSNDLDVFGHASLFQWLNITNTFFGREALGRLLKSPEKKAEQIRKRQSAIKELSEKIDFCQNLQCEGMRTPEASKNPDKLLDFSEDSTKLFRHRLAVQKFYILPELTIIFAIICMLDISVSPFILLFLIAIQAAVNVVCYGKANNTLRPVSYYRNEVKAYQKMIELIEKEEFNDEYLKELKSRLFTEKRPASAQIKDLEKIVDTIDIGKGYIVEFILNLLLFWNVHCVFALEKWKARSGKAIRNWLQTIGDFEALSSLALAAQMNPEWAFPDISDQKVSFSAVNMGHPLINGNKRVCNSINMDNKICIVTGSNMSGKTTLLRTSGINLLLAYAGTAVCAKKMTCSAMDICTSMRIADDLNEGISTFYAELLRIKMIIDHSRKKKPMIFLIDEVFRGTNSSDRVTGARNVLLNLNKDWVVGMISTHDFELCSLEKGHGGRVENYHFTETYTNNEIKFDYVLRKGQCKTTNARYLMKMVGIEILDE